ncbi:MAG: hypothetical protein GY797_16650 [Deltaproteobacteria bacterium]|nr:hypothetical protein [Deltaproteobacteria bacterium]
MKEILKAAILAEKDFIVFFWERRKWFLKNLAKQKLMGCLLAGSKNEGKNEH